MHSPVARSHIRGLEQGFRFEKWFAIHTILFGARSQQINLDKMINTDCLLRKRRDDLRPVEEMDVNGFTLLYGEGRTDNSLLVKWRCDELIVIDAPDNAMLMAWLAVWNHHQNPKIEGEQ